MATEDQRYRQSSQFRLWSFSPSQLAAQRAKTNELAIKNNSEVLPVWAAIEAASASASASVSTSANPSDSNTPNPTAPTAPAAEPSTTTSTASAPADVDSTATGAPSFTMPEFLTPEEELYVLRSSTAMILKSAQALDMPTETRATCAIFLRRFYITNSIMTYPPAQMLKTCLFFGSKAEGQYLKLSHLARDIPSFIPEMVLAGEFLLCQGIRFAFDVKHPYRACEGAFMELRGYGEFDEKHVEDVRTRAREILKFSPLMTDAYFHYTPSQIMLAAVLMADKPIFERLFRGMFPPGDPATDGVRDKVLATVEACRDMMAQEPPERMTQYWGTPEAKAVNKPLLAKLKLCRDPQRVDLVKLQQNRRLNTDKKEGEKLGVATLAKKTIKDDGDVFGGVLDGGADNRESKRRKVDTTADPFGPPM